MSDWDVFEEIIDRGKRQGTVTYDEITDALPAEFFSPDDLQNLLDLLQDMGIRVSDEQPDTHEEETGASAP